MPLPPLPRLPPAAAAKKSQQLALTSGPFVQKPPGQGTSKTAKARAKAAAAAAAAVAGGGGGGGGRPPLALTNDGVGDGTAKGKGKGKGKGNGACYAWNDGKPCAQNPCSFKHICSKCGGDHKRGACTN